MRTKMTTRFGVINRQLELKPLSFQSYMAYLLASTTTDSTYWQIIFMSDKCWMSRNTQTCATNFLKFFPVLCRFSQKALLGLVALFRLRAVCVDICCSWWLHHLFVPQLSNLCGACRILGCVYRGNAWSSSILQKPCQSIHFRNEVLFTHFQFFMFIGECL